MATDTAMNQKKKKKPHKEKKARQTKLFNLKENMM